MSRREEAAARQKALALHPRATDERDPKVEVNYEEWMREWDAREREQKRRTG